VYRLPCSNVNPQLAPFATVCTTIVRPTSPLYTVSTSNSTLTGSADDEHMNPNGSALTRVTTPVNTAAAFAACASVVEDGGQLHATAGCGPPITATTAMRINAA